MLSSRTAVAALFVACLAATIPAQADTPATSADAASGQPPAVMKTEKGSTVKIEMPPAASKNETAYQDAIKNLSKEQLDKLKAFEGDYAKAADFDMQVLSRSMELSKCVEKDAGMKKDEAKYRSEMGVLANELQSQGLMMRAKLGEQTKQDITFVDPKVLRGHFIFTANLMLALGSQMAGINYKEGAFDKTDCAALQTKLDDAFKHALDVKAKPQQPKVLSEEVLKMQKAADGGDLDAMASLGLAYVGGMNVDKDVTKGMAMLNAAADKGYERAEYLLGLVLSTDQMGAPADKEKAKYWLGKAAAQGNHKAEDMLKMVDEQKPEEPTDVLRKRAEAGDGSAEYMIGSRYWQGTGGVEKNHDEALKWLLLAAGQGHPLAQSDLSSFLFMDDADAPEALMWMTSAAQKGVTNSQLELADVYMAGKLLPKDEDQAIYWYKHAAANGDSRAMRSLQALAKPE